MVLISKASDYVLLVRWDVILCPRGIDVYYPKNDSIEM